jgi:hypothetical protein
MSQVALRNTASKTGLSKFQKRFNQLKKKIVNLRNRLNQTETILDKGLQFFQIEVVPVKDALRDAISDLVKVLYQCHKNPKGLSKKQKSHLKALIVINCKEVLALSSSIDEVDLEIQEIFKEIEGFDCHSVHYNPLEKDKEMLTEMCKDLNLDIDLDSIDLANNQEAIFAKIFEAMAEARKKQEAESPEESKPESEKEIQKELKAKELEKIQKEGVGGLYKKLAKALHPDLEQDKDLKIEKEELMKRLTAAYQNNDLHGLLSIEVEWFNRTESDESEGKLPSDEQLKIFNSLLKDQADELEAVINMTIYHPRYYSLQQFINLEDTSHVLFELNNLRSEMKRDLRAFTEMVKDLQSPAANDALIYLLQPPF